MTGSVTSATASAVHSPTTRLVRDYLSYVPSVLFPAAFSLIGVAIFTRIFPPAEYGLYSLALAVTGPAIKAASEFVAHPAVRFYAEFEQRHERDVYLRAISLVTSLVCLAVTMIILLALLGMVAIYETIPFKFLVVGAAVMLVAQCTFSAVAPVLTVGFQKTVYRTVMILSSGGSIGVSLLLVLFVSRNIAWLVWGTGITSLILLPYLYYRTSIPFRANLWSIPPDVRSAAWRFLRYGMPLALWGLAYAVLDTSDRYVIQFFYGAEQVGIYSVHYALVTQAFMLFSVPFWVAASPILMQQWAADASEGVRATLSRATDAYIVVGCCAVGGIAAIARPLSSSLFGENFGEGYRVFFPVALAMLIWGMSVLGRKSFEFVERPKVILYSGFAAAAVNLLLNIALVPVLGYLAAAYTTFASIGVFTILIWWNARTGVPWDVPLRSLGYSICASFLGWLVGILVINSSQSLALQILAGGGSFLVVYTATLLLFRTNDCRTFLSFVRNTYR